MLSDVRIKKVMMLQGVAKVKAEKMGLDPEDLVIVTTTDVTLEKIVGDPVNYLMNRIRDDEEKVCGVLCPDYGEPCRLVINHKGSHYCENSGEIGHQ